MGAVSGLNHLTARAQINLLRRKEATAVELLDVHLAAIADRNPDVNAVVALDPEVGRARAEGVDARFAAGDDPGPLAGLVTAHKDLTETVDFPTTYGSPIFADNRPDSNSLLVQRMTDAGAVAVGKTNTPEFGAGSHSFNPVYGVTRNAFDPSRSAGGSSGGAAVALATHMIAIADGSDYGGSLRNPAAWNDVLGFRPSLGAIPHLDGGNPYLRLGVTGPMARDVDDLALLLGVLAVPDPRDPVSRGLVVPDRIDPVDRPLRVAWSDDLGGLPIEPEITAVLHRFRQRCDDLGWVIVDETPDFRGADECFETLRSWRRVSGQIADLGARRREVKATILDEFERGQELTPAEVSGALEHMGVLWRRAIAFFTDIDLLIAPVTQISPFPIDWEYPTEVAGVPMETYITWMRSACRITSMQVPALSFPAGFTAEGLPVGAQLIGAPHDDIGVLRAAKSLELAA